MRYSRNGATLIEFIFVVVIGSIIMTVMLGDNPEETVKDGVKYVKEQVKDIQDRSVEDKKPTSSFKARYFLSEKKNQRLNTEIIELKDELYACQNPQVEPDLNFTGTGYE